MKAAEKYYKLDRELTEAKIKLAHKGMAPEFKIDTAMTDIKENTAQNKRLVEVGETDEGSLSYVHDRPRRGKQIKSDGKKRSRTPFGRSHQVLGVQVELGRRLQRVCPPAHTKNDLSDDKFYEKDLIDDFEMYRTDPALDLVDRILQQP